MRDPSRIDKVLSVLNDIWHEYPDLRFNQLITNLQRDYCHVTGEAIWFENILKYNGNHTYVETKIPNLFNLEDDKFYNFLVDYRDDL